MKIGDNSTDSALYNVRVKFRMLCICEWSSGRCVFTFSRDEELGRSAGKLLAGTLYTEVDPFKWNLYESVKRLKVTESKEVLAEPEYTGVVKDGLKHFNLGRLKGGKSQWSQKGIHLIGTQRKGGKVPMSGNETCGTSLGTWWADTLASQSSHSRVLERSHWWQNRCAWNTLQPLYSAV